jgi:release factor glutamine methyltransferase
MDGTPIYDIKPYVTYADSHPEARSGFVDQSAWQELEVVIPEDVSALFSIDEMASLKQVLALDPRPRYQEDPERIYGMPFGSYDIRFKVARNVLTVVEAIPSKMTYESLWHRLTPLYETEEAKAIVRWVLDVRFGLSWADILCGKVSELSLDHQKELLSIMLRLEKGEPVQYIIGVADFCGRQFHVAPGVLIPRPETSELCRWTISCRKEAEEKILDIGTGSGCIAITLALEKPEAKVTAWDISDGALSIAKKNANNLGAQVIFEEKDALNLQKESGQWDIIVSNPPYIKPQERDGMAKNVLDYEPQLALFAPEDDPIIFYERIGDYAWQSLNSGGLLFFELNPLTAEAVGDYLRQLGFSEIEIREDQYGKQRFLKAKKI